MGIQDLQTFLELGAVPNATVPVDLSKIGVKIAMNAQRKNKYVNQHQMQQNPYRNQLTLVIDGECCLDRLYGGFYSDWACGGQWGHMLNFLSQFVQESKRNNIEMAVLFNGSIDELRMDEWVDKQLQERQKIDAVLKHINLKGTPPPKIWWVPPAGLRSVLRMAFRTLRVCVGLTMEDHKLELLHYLNENQFSAIVADDAEYVVLQPERYFSAKHLKLRFSGSLETKEFIVSELLKGLDLPTERLCVVASLLGNSFLSSKDLQDFYIDKLGLKNIKNGLSAQELVRAVVTFVKNLTQQDNVDSVVTEIFGTDKDPRAPALKESIFYYYNGPSGLKPPKNNPRRKNKNNKDKKSQHDKKSKGSTSSNTKEPKEEKETKESEEDDLSNEPDLDTSQLASEVGDQNELDNLTKYKEVTNCLNSTGPEIIDSAPANEINGNIESSEDSPAATECEEIKSSKPTTSNSITKSNTKKKVKTSQLPLLPNVPTEVIRTVAERHNKGAMSPLIYQIYTHGEIRLPVLMENENNNEVPNIQLFYRPIRQKVYAILFNLHHHTFMATKNKSDKKPDIRIREWVWSKTNQFERTDYVRAEQLKWGVPTVQRLWFGTTVDDRRRRLRAFLTCMRSDTNLMLHTDYVPQHLLLMACVLRYIMSFTDKRVLRRQELDAFIVTAVSPDVMNTEQIQDLQLPVVTLRGVQLSTLFMTGVETALLVNDTCGAPIPWIMNCTWLFFDGKLFNYYLSKAATCKNIEELCDHRISIVVKVEKMRQAILEGIDYQFARPPITSPFVRPPQMMPPNEMIPHGFIPPMGPPNNIRGGMGRGCAFYNNINNNTTNNFPRRTPAPSSVGGAGGKLEIAGVVVGSWASNYNYSSMPQGRGGPGLLMNPHMNSVGDFPHPADPNYRGEFSHANHNNTNMMRRRPIRVQPPVQRRFPTGGMKRSPHINNFNKTRPPKPAGRGMTVVNPTTGETKLASDILAEQQQIHTTKDTSEVLNGTSSEQFENDTTVVNGSIGASSEQPVEA